MLKSKFADLAKWIYLHPTEQKKELLKPISDGLKDYLSNKKCTPIDRFKRVEDIARNFFTPLSDIIKPQRFRVDPLSPLKEARYFDSWPHYLIWYAIDFPERWVEYKDFLSDEKFRLNEESLDKEYKNILSHPIFPPQDLLDQFSKSVSSLNADSQENDIDLKIEEKLFPHEKSDLETASAETIDSNVPRVAIVGGGFSGTLTAIRLMQFATSPLSITVFEKSAASQHGGIAYGEDTAGWEHLLNIQAGRISLYREHPVDFLVWANEEAKRDTWILKWENVQFTESSSVPRRIYRQYLQDRFEREKSRSKLIVNIHWINSEVVDLFDLSRSIEVVYRDQDVGNSLETSSLHFDQVILATGHGESHIPGSIAKLTDHPRFLASPFSPHRDLIYKQLDKSSHVVIAGTGLSAFDAVVSLLEFEFNGRITMFSRNGLMHGTYSVGHSHEIIRIPSSPLNDAQITALDLAEIVRSRVGTFRHQSSHALPANIASERALKAMESWFVESLAGMSKDEVRTFLASNKSWLTTSRTSVVPEVGEAIAKVLSGPSPKGDVLRGDFVSASIAYNDKIVVRISTDSGEREIECDAFISCLGRSADYSSSSDGLWKQLIEDRRIAQPHQTTSQGIEVGPFGEVIVANQTASNALSCVGPMRQGDEILRHGRTGAFVFSIGTIRNQALVVALNILMRLDSEKFRSLNSSQMRTTENIVTSKIDHGKSGSNFKKLIEAAEQFILDFHNRGSDQRTIQGIDEFVEENFDSGDQVIRHLVHFQALLKAAETLTDISKLPNNYHEVRRYSNTHHEDFTYEREKNKRILQSITRRMKAKSASLFVYKSVSRELFPFVEYRRREPFTVTKYGSAVAGNLIKEYLERNELIFDEAVRICRQGDERLCGAVIENYNRISKELKKNTYSNQESMKRKYPEVLIGVIESSGSPYGLIYLEAEEGRRFKCNDVETLLSACSSMIDLLKEAGIKWNTSPINKFDDEDLRGADFKGQILFGSTFRNADISDAEFSYANLGSADLNGANCVKTNFCFSEMRHSRLVGASLEKAELDGADLRGASLAGANFRNARMNDTRLIGATIENVDFSLVDFSGIEIIDTSVVGTDFSGSIIRDSRLESLSDVDQAKWDGTIFENVLMDRETFSSLPALARQKYVDAIDLI